MSAGRGWLVLAAMGFSVLIVVLTLLVVSMLRVPVDLRDWVVAVVTAVIVGGFLALLVMRRGLDAEVLEQRAQRAHVPAEDLEPGRPTTTFRVEEEHVLEGEGDKADGPPP